MIKLGITGKMSCGKSFVSEKIKLRLEQDDYKVLYISVDEIRRGLKTSDINIIKRNIVDMVSDSDADVLLLEWALLIEDGMAPLVDNNILIVHCSEDKIYQRLSNPDLPLNEIKRRLDSQTDWTKYKGKLKMLNNVLWLNTENDITECDIEKVIYGLQEFDKNTSDLCLFRIPQNGGRVIWEVTNKCNYKCPYCIFSSTNKSKAEELTTEQALNLLNEMSKLGYTHLKITGGEPFLRKDIMKILEQAKSLNLKTDISTNASLITDKVARNLSNLDLDMVHVSLDGHTKTIHETARGKNTFEPTIIGIKNLTAQSNIYVRIGCLIFKDNENYLKEIAEFCEELGANEIIFSLMEAVGRGNSAKHLISEKPASYFISKIKDIKPERIKVSFNFPQEKQNDLTCICPGGKRFLFINSVGTVSPCTWITERAPEYIYKTSLREDSLKNILNDSKYTDTVSIINKLGAKKCPAQIVQDLRKVQKLKDAVDNDIDSDERFSHNSPTYLFTTENLRDTFVFGNISRALTIGSSGDHFFNAVLRGAKDVDCFDINIFSKYITELKKIAVEHLSYDDFIQMFFENNKDIYTGFRHFLSIPCRYVGDLIFSPQRQRILKDMYISKPQILYNCGYLNSEVEYNNLKKLLPGVNFNFILTDVQFLDKKFNKKYDLMHLSNISDYAHLMFKNNYLLQFNENVIKPLLPYLTDNGLIICGYVYDSLDKNQSSKRSKINIEAERKEAFANNPNFSYSEREIKTAVGEDNFDTILMIKKNVKNLLEKSDIYYKKANIYEIFSQAEDAPNLIYKTLLPLFRDKNILDIGCGTGKYIKLFAPHVKSILGVDAAEDQLSIARKSINNLEVNWGNSVKLCCSDIAEMSFSKSYDIAFASWVLGTITNGEKRLKALNNIKDALNENGKIFLVENDFGGEFEDIRGRVNDPKKRTESYNNWLLKQGFKIEYRLETYFEFSNTQEAKNVIETIWGIEAAKKVKQKHINHKIIIFSWSKMSFPT